MRTFLSALIILLGLASTASADVFNIPIGTSWIKVQDGKVVQWSVIPPNMVRPTRLDLLSYVENEVRTTYYLIRRACQNGKVEVQRILPGHVLGIGLDCTGNIPATSILPVILHRVDKLPTEAAALLPKS